MFKKFIATLLITALMVVPVYANDAELPTPERIPYNVAVRGAVRDLATLTALDDAIEDLQDIRDDLRSLLELRRVSGTLTRPEESEMERQLANLLAQINTMRANQEMIRISTEFAMRNSMTTINNTLLDLHLLEATIAHGKNALDMAQLRFNAGLISESDLRSQELALQQQESQLATLQVMLESERQALNTVLQRPLTGYFYVYYQQELIDLPEDLNAHIRRVAPQAPNVRQRDITLSRARAYLNDVNLDFGSPVRQERERARNQAERERNETLRNVETAMRNHYNALTALLHSNESLQIDLERATNLYETVQLNYQAGLAAQFNLEEARLGVLNAENAIQRNVNTFWNMQFMFENPFLLAQQAQ